MKKRIFKQIVKFSIFFIVIAALLMGMALPAMAQTTTPAALHIVQGKVISISASPSSFVIQNGNQAPVTITVDTNTKFYVVPVGRVQSYVNNLVSKDINEDKGKENKAGALKEAHIPANWKSNLGWLDTFNTRAQFSDIKVDDRVIARVNTSNLASQVMIIKAPVIQTIKGTISAVTASSVTITPVSGSAVTLTIDGKTHVTLDGSLSVQINQTVTAVYNKNTLVAQTLNVKPAAPLNPPASSLTSINISSAVSGNLTVGGVRQFVATGLYLNGANQDITSQVNWASTNPGIATITNKGVATGVAAGTTSITAFKNGISSPAMTLAVTAP